MKSLKFSTSLVLFVLAIVHAHEDSSKPVSNIRTVAADDTSRHDRQLSMWSSFLSFVKCPPGPLGGGCRSSGSSSGGSSSGGSSSGSSSDSYPAISGSPSSSGGDASNDGGSGSYTDIVSDYDSAGKYYNYYSNDGEDSGTATANGVRHPGYTWTMVLGGMALLAAGVAAVAHATSTNHDTVSAVEAGGAYTLTGSVIKMNVAFKDAMKLKLGCRKDVSDLEESLA